MRDTLTFEPKLDPVLTEGRRVLVGFGVVRSWRFVHSQFQSWESRSLAEAALANRPRQKGARFLEHEVIESVISQGTSVGDKLQEHFSDIGSVGSVQLLETAMTLPGNVLTGDGQVEDLRVVLAEWVQKFGIKVKSGLPIWAAWWPFALALANGTRKSDVSVIWQRQDGLEAVLHAPTLPSANAIAKFKQLVAIPHLPAGPSDSAPQELASTMVKRGSVSMYTAESMLKSLRFSRHLKKNADFKVAVIEGVDCAMHFLHERADLTELKSDTRMPTRWTLERGAVILDIATMLAQRSVRDTKGPSYRYYGFDASPQRSGVEVFATLERSVLKSTMRLQEDKWGPWICGDSIQRRLPLMALGQGRSSLSDKARAHANQVWLERGGSVQRYLESNLEVRGVISDMGTESGIGNYVDISHELFGHKDRPSKAQSFNGYMYPLALSIPGTQHAVDNVVKDAIKNIDWFAEWASDAKSLCQWVNQSGHRDKLKDILRNRENLPEDVDKVALAKDLDTGCERFASWRWKTVTLTTSSLLRLRRALQQTVGHCHSASDLDVSDNAVAQTLIKTVNCDAFWCKTGALNACFQPLGKFSSWLSGCPCHEKERMAGQVIARCDWQGCRGPELFAKFDALLEEFDQLGKQGQRLGVVSGETFVIVAIVIRASLSRRFAWLEDIEFQIWKVALGVGLHFLIDRPAVFFMCATSVSQTVQVKTYSYMCLR